MKLLLTLFTLISWSVFAAGPPTSISGYPNIATLQSNYMFVIANPGVANYNITYGQLTGQLAQAGGFVKMNAGTWTNGTHNGTLTVASNGSAIATIVFPDGYPTRVGFNALPFDNGGTGLNLGYNNLGSSTAFGNGAGYSNTIGSVTAFGFLAASSNTIGVITALGKWAGQNNASGHITAVGNAALRNSVATTSTAVGDEAGGENTTGDVTALGYYAARSNIDGIITAIGMYAGANNIHGNSTAVGYFAGYNDTGVGFTGVGYQAGYSNTTGNATAVGKNALFANRASDATAVGYGAGFNNVSGLITAVGALAGLGNTSGNMTGVGYNAGRGNTTGNTVALGYQSGYSGTTGNETAIGYNSLFSATTGNMIALGYQAGYGLTSANAPVADTAGILIGNNANRSVASATVLTDYIGLGDSVLIDKSHQAKLGSTTITETLLYGNVGIDTATPFVPLDVVGTITMEKSHGGYFSSWGYNGNDPYLDYYGATGFQIGYGESTSLPPTVNSMRFLVNGDVQASTTITATNGFASRATTAGVSLVATGITNNMGINATAYVTATAVAFTIQNRSQATLYTSPTLTTTISVHLQPGWSVNAASGLAGVLLPD